MTDAATEIPWSVSWTGEQAFRVQPSRDFPGMLELDQRHAPGVGEPVFAVMHVSRQRRAVADLLCHVCGQPTSSHDRFIFPTASGGLVTLQDGSQQYGCNVPPMHRACSARARASCPHLLRVNEPPLRCGRDTGRLISRTDLTPGLEALARELPSNANVVFSCYRLFGADFTAKVMQARADWAQASKARKAALRGTPKST